LSTCLGEAVEFLDDGVAHFLGAGLHLAPAEMAAFAAALDRAIDADR
jgi:hypothetical protein